MTDWLDDKLGPPTFEQDGTPLPKRARVVIEGATITDDPATKKTTLTFDAAIAQAAAVAALTNLRGLLDASRVHRQARFVQSERATFLFLDDEGAGLPDDTRNVIKPTDVSLGDNGRWYRTPAQTLFNVLDYGADATGAVASEGAIQAALDAASVSGGGRVFLPPGTYLLESKILIPSNVTLYGAGRGVSILRAAQPWTRVAGEGFVEMRKVTDAHLRDMTLDQNSTGRDGTPSTDAIDHSLVLGGSSSCSVERVQFLNAGIAESSGLTPSGPILLLVAKDDNDNDIGGQFVEADADCSDNVLRDLDFTQSGVRIAKALSLITDYGLIPPLPPDGGAGGYSPFAGGTNTTSLRSRAVDSGGDDFVNHLENTLIERCSFTGIFALYAIGIQGGATRHNTVRNCRFNAIEGLDCVLVDKGAYGNTVSNCTDVGHERDSVVLTSTPILAFADNSHPAYYNTDNTFEKLRVVEFTGTLQYDTPFSVGPYCVRSKWKDCVADTLEVPSDLAMGFVLGVGNIDPEITRCIVRNADYGVFSNLGGAPSVNGSGGKIEACIFDVAKQGILLAVSGGGAIEGIFDVARNRVVCADDSTFGQISIGSSVDVARVQDNYIEMTGTPTGSHYGLVVSSPDGVLARNVVRGAGTSYLFASTWGGQIDKNRSLDHTVQEYSYQSGATTPLFSLLQSSLPQPATRRVECVSVSNVAALTGAPAVVDGISVPATLDVLFVAQTDATENGIWTVQSGAWTRALSLQEGEPAGGIVVHVKEGSSYADSMWLCTSNTGTDTVGTDTLAYSEIRITNPQSLYRRAEVVATTNQTLSGAPVTIDSISVPAGSEILLTGQTDATENGLWHVNLGAWTRSLQMLAGIAARGMMFGISVGSSYADTLWICTSNSGSDVVGTNTLAFSSIASSAVYAAVVAATSSNFASTIVKRDASGNFSAQVGTFVGLNVTGLTASQAVVTDASKNLASLGYATAATATTLVERDSSGNINVVGLNASGLTASQAVVTDGSKNLASLAYDTAATASAIVQRDSSGNINVVGVNASALTASRVVATDGSKNFVSLTYGSTAAASALVQRGSNGEITAGAANAATTGLINASSPNTNFSGILLSMRNNGNTLDLPVLWTDASNNLVFGYTANTGDIYVGSPAAKAVILRNNATVRIKVDGTGIGFFNTAPAAQQTVTGSRGGNAALASLLTALATLGLVVDSSSA